MIIEKANETELSNNKIHVTVRGIFVLNNFLLVCYDPRKIPNHYYEPGKTFYYLPGGHIEFGESARQSLIREIKEETNYNCKIRKYLGIMEHSWNLHRDNECCHTHEINLIFKINIEEFKDNVDIDQQEEHVAFKWISLRELYITDLRPEPIKSFLDNKFNHVSDNFISYMNTHQN